MQRPSTRRKFIATLGAAGTVSLAGCSSILGGDSSSPSDPTATTEGDNSQSPATSGTDATTTDTGGGKGESAPGQLVDDFENDITSRWAINFGKYKVVKQDAFQGSQSLVLEPKKSDKQPVAKISKSFYPNALDLSSHDLSIAAKVNKPKDIKISAEIIAPAESDMLTATRYIPQELNDWVRFDLGYTDITGKPALGKVAQVNIQIGPLQKGKDFQVLIDDLRKIPKPKKGKGKVMFQFDDGDASVYKKAFPVLKEKGWPGTVGVIPDAVNSNGRITGKMMREMGKANWDMVGHAGELLPQLSESKQRRVLQKTQQYLKVKNFKKGARHFIVPYSRVNKTTLNLLDELYDTAYLFGAGPNNAQHPSNPQFISRVQGTSVRGTRRILDVAEKTNQLVVISYHGIGTGGENSIPVKNFKQVVNHVGKKDMDVITPSQLVSSKSW